jgi:hypothetical protein
MGIISVWQLSTEMASWHSNGKEKTNLIRKTSVHESNNLPLQAANNFIIGSSKTKAKIQVKLRSC